MLAFDTRTAGLRRGAPAAPNHAATTALVARMTMPPVATRVAAIDRLVRALIEADVWSRLEALYLMAAHHPQAAWLDWTGQHGSAAIGGGAPVVIADRGTYCDGRDDWIDLGFAPAQAQRYGQNSAAIAIWARNGNAGQTASVFGIDGSNAVGLNPRGANGVIASRLNSSTATVGGAVSTGYGLTAVDRSSSTGVLHYKDGCRAARRAVRRVAHCRARPSRLGGAAVPLPRTSSARWSSPPTSAARSTARSMPR